MKEEHTHDWKYNEAHRVVSYNPNNIGWTVERFCPDCRLIEEIPLKESDL